MSTSRYLFKFNVEDIIPLYLSEQIAECTEDINGVRRQTASKTKPAIKKTTHEIRSQNKLFNNVGLK